MRCPQAVLSRWRKRRTALQDLVDAGDPDRWIWSVQLKVVTFLVSRYDPGETGAPPAEDLESAPPPSPALFHVPCPQIEPPRASGAIRAILEDIHRNVQAPAGIEDA